HRAVGRGDPGRHHHGRHRCTVLHLDRPPTEGAGAVMLRGVPTLRQAQGAARAQGAAPAPTADIIAAGRRARRRRHANASIVLGIVLFAIAAAALMLGNTFYTPGEVIRVILGETVPGASFTVGELRLPRTVLAILAGFAFGIAGVAFQTLLRNPLASPDIIGITEGASAAAVVGIVT